MSRIYVPIRKTEDWKMLLEDPDKHWVTGYSAKTLAYCWIDACDDFPKCVRKVFTASGIEPFTNLELLAAFPE